MAFDPPAKAIIFDFDGLIVDTETPAFHAWSAIFREHGVTLKLAEWVQCVGTDHGIFDPVDHLDVLLKAGGLAKDLDRIALFADKDQRKSAISAVQPVLPGVVERMAEARALGLKIAVASSSGATWVKGHLSRIGLDVRVDAVVTKEDVARVKPFPDIYLKAAAVLGVAPAEGIAFEDSLNGVKAAKAAGMRCFAIPNGVTSGLDFAAADGVFPSLAALSLRALI